MGLGCDQFQHRVRREAGGAEKNLMRKCGEPVCHQPPMKLFYPANRRIFPDYRVMVVVKLQFFCCTVAVFYCKNCYLIAEFGCYVAHFLSYIAVL